MKRKKLYDYQESVLSQLRTGSILCGGVGSGKSVVGVEYYLRKIPPWKQLYIITTAKKRNEKEWEEKECPEGLIPIVDSWNNIKKYVGVKDSFFIFDEQKVTGRGVWVKSFLKITASNDWILLTATPGDTWEDYLPIFMANKFYKTRREFYINHVVFSPWTKFPKIEKYINVSKLEDHKNDILIMMDSNRKIEKKYIDVKVDYDKTKYSSLLNTKMFNNKPVKNITELLFLERKICNSDSSRFGVIQSILEKHRKIIVFYNFNYELEILRELARFDDIVVSEYNGHKHEKLPDSDKWIYLVQYTSGAEGWNCIQTNTIVFYSLNYSYSIMVQAGGRIDRVNTPFNILYYYYLISESSIDKAIKKALNNKKDFNESDIFSLREKNTVYNRGEVE